NSRSEIRRAIGPMHAPSDSVPLATGTCPSIGTKPVVGFSPAIPQKCAGTRIDPERSLPIPAGERHAAIAAASPPLEPPAVHSRLYGLLVRPKMGLSLSYETAISGVFVFPKMMAPADLSRATAVASRSGTSLIRNREPLVVRSPLVSIVSLIVI